MKIPKRVEAFILGEPLSDRRQLIKVLEQIEEDPLIGTYLPFPYQPEVLRLTIEDKYFITYRILDTIEVGAITHMLDFESIMGYLQED